ncbi:efflux RND transporter permease subunit [Sneathiella sp. HT1-7]|uniref:efflux RND transporter permease subunit n=1 Tax=Sneathiella sp. HT1-7 TaxID=2887192 RepID=UPI001D151D4E|nr:efflux RND transporter permease subunit [Sneathiella sp. HT1-7]MCC3303343.1 efflux RND transporter permease subunit [Sneathiella sp. HT1-7]
MKDITETHNTARYFTENRHISWVLLLAVFMWGIYGYLSMPKAKDPAIQVRVASVITSWPGADATKIEQLVTRPIEQQIALSSTLHPVGPTKFAVKSLTLPNLSIVQIQLEETLDDTKSAFNEIDLNLKALGLPDGAGPIQFNDGFGDTAAILMTIASPTENPVEISLRARDIEAAIKTARSNAAGDGSKRRSLIVVMPRDIALTTPGRNMDLFKDYLVKDGVASAIISMEGAGFIGLDLSTSLSDADLKKELRDFLHTKLAQVSFHEDAWPAIVIDDPAKTNDILQASPGGKYSYRELDDFSNLIIRNLQTIPLVTVVNTSGVVDERIFLEYSQDLLASYGLTPGDVSGAISARNSDISGGEFYASGSSVLVEPVGKYTSPDQIGGTAFTTSPSGAPVYLRDIGDVVPGYQSPPEFLNYYNWRDENGRWKRGKAISLAIQMRDGGQIGKFGEAVDTILKEVRPHLPDDLVVERISNQPSQVAENIDLFMTALIEAIVLVVVISLVGFWEWRSALLMMISIPITLAMTFGIIDTLGIQLQQVSIATLIIALGLLVDDPVVAGDAIKRGLAAGQPRTLAAWLGPTKLAHAIMFATITNVVAYLPFLLLSGNTGEFLYSLPIVMTTALVCSRLVSMSFLPFLGYYLLRAQNKPELTIEERRERGFSGLYFRVGSFLINHRKKALLVSFAFIALIIPLSKTLKTSFFPDDVQYLFYADVTLRNNANIHETQKVVENAVQIIKGVATQFGASLGPEGGGDPLESIASFIGGGAPRFWFSVTPQLHQRNYAQLVMRVNNKDLTAELIPYLQHALSAKIPEAIIDVRQLQTNPVPYPIEIRLAAKSAVQSDGPESEAEIATLRELAGGVLEILAKAPNAARPREDWGGESLRLRIEIDPDRAFLAGVTNQNIAASSSAGLNGNQVTTLQQGDKNIPVVSILKPSERAQLSDLENLYVFATTSNNKIPLGQIASVEYQLHTERIRREEHFRTVNVRTFPLAGVLPSEVMTVIKDDLAAFKEKLPPGFTMEITGEQANAQHGFQQLAKVMAISIGLIFVALVFQFKNAVKPLVVLAAVPYGIIGALIALAVTNSPFGFMAFLGIVALIGVIVSHIIVLFDFIEEMHEKDEPLRLALLDAGIVRLRPVLITVGATVFGLGPLALHGGPLWQPLCYAQIGGLTIATFTTLLLVPVIYSIFVLDLKAIKWEERAEPAIA